jgi:hypothetical protein
MMRGSSKADWISLGPGSLHWPAMAPSLTTAKYMDCISLAQPAGPPVDAKEKQRMNVR